MTTNTISMQEFEEAMSVVFNFCDQNNCNEETNRAYYDLQRGASTMRKEYNKSKIKKNSQQSCIQQFFKTTSSS